MADEININLTVTYINSQRLRTEAEILRDATRRRLPDANNIRALNIEEQRLAAKVGFIFSTPKPPQQGEIEEIAFNPEFMFPYNPQTFRYSEDSPLGVLYLYLEPCRCKTIVIDDKHGCCGQVKGEHVQFPDDTDKGHIWIDIGSDRHKYCLFTYHQHLGAEVVNDRRYFQWGHSLHTLENMPPEDRCYRKVLTRRLEERRNLFRQLRSYEIWKSNGNPCSSHNLHHCPRIPNM